MKKIVGDALKVGGIIILLLLCCLPLLLRKSSGTVSRSFFDDIYEDVQGYYSSVKGDLKENHRLRVSFNYDELSDKTSFLKKYETEGLAAYKKAGNIHDVITFAKGKLGNNNGQVNILTGYINTRVALDKVFKSVKTEKQGNLTVNIKDGDPEYYVYTMSAYEKDKSKSYLQKARDVKKRVEDLILVYQVTRKPKYLAALKKEIVEASRWENYWQTTQYIDTAEMAYAVSLGYDYAYNTLPDSQKCVIENRLLSSILYYGTRKASDALNGTSGNFNQVGHSGAGIVALTLINSSDKGRIRVLSVDSEGITIAYPVKRMEDGKVAYDYKKDLLVSSGTARITDPALRALLVDRIQTSNGVRFIPLRTYYAAVIAKTIDYLPNVLKTGNMYVDGSYPEGKDYYLFGMKYFSYYLATLKNTFPNTFKSRYYDNLVGFEKKANYPNWSEEAVNNIVLNPVYISNANGRNLDYGDAKRNAIEHEDSLFYLTNLNAEYGGYEETAKVVYDYRRRTENKWGLYSIMWYNESYDAKGGKIDFVGVFNDAIYKNKRVGDNLDKLAVSAFRDAYTNKNGIFVAMIGGKNNYNHMHLDLGSFVYYAMGTEWIVDAGSQYDGTKYHDRDCSRWQYYVTRAEAHSTIVIKKPGAYTIKNVGTCVAADQWINANAPFRRLDSSDNSGYAELILTDAYNKTNNDLAKSGTNKNSVRRGLKLFNHKKYVLIEDEVSLTSLSSYYSFLNINKGIKVELAKDGQSALLSDGNNYVKLILKTESSSSKVNISLKTVKSVTGGKGVLDGRILNPKNNTKASLGTNVSRMNAMYGSDTSKQQNRLVVYAENGQQKQTSSLVNMRIGVFIIPLYTDKNAEIDEDVLKLSDPYGWEIPDAPKIAITQSGREVSSGEAINGSAIIEIAAAGKMGKNGVLKYSLDLGKTWYKYDGSADDISRRTLSGTDERVVDVWAVADDGAGLQSDTTKVSGFKIKFN